ncbi:hypothetical protein [Parashewanella tropica]|uniref:hypothetical protein n=1 Tax=Parashewanella tropica TaxID=2547970 RepID=UPI00105A2673|nr:hypothetical protein [Parashewanella tropica]
MAGHHDYIGQQRCPSEYYDYQWQYQNPPQNHGYQRYPEYQKQPYGYNDQHGYSAGGYRVSDQRTPSPATHSQYEATYSEDISGRNQNPASKYDVRYYHPNPNDYLHFTTQSNHSFFIRHELRFSSLETKTAITNFFDTMAYLDDQGQGNTQAFADKIYGIYDNVQQQDPRFAMVLRGFSPDARHVLQVIKEEHEQVNFSTPCPYNGHTTSNRPGGSRKQTTRILAIVPQQSEPPLQQAEETGQLMPTQETHQQPFLAQKETPPKAKPRNKFMPYKTYS